MCSCVPRPTSGEGDHDPRSYIPVRIGGFISKRFHRFFFRFQDGSGSGSGSVTLDQKFLLKWSVPLSFVEVLEFGSSEDAADTGRFPPPHSGEKVVISAKPSTTPFGTNLVNVISLVDCTVSAVEGRSSDTRNCICFDCFLENISRNIYFPASTCVFFPSAVLSFGCRSGDFSLSSCSPSHSCSAALKGPDQTNSGPKNSVAFCGRSAALFISGFDLCLNLPGVCCNALVTYFPWFVQSLKN